LLIRLLVNRQFAQVWLAGAVSTVGDFVFDTTVLLWISTVLARGQPWAPTAASGVLIAVLVPTVAVGPLAIGPPLAAPLLFTAGVEWALALNALSFVFSFAVIRSVRAPAAPVRGSAVGDAGGSGTSSASGWRRSCGPASPGRW